MQDSGVVEFRRIHNQIQMIWQQRRLRRQRPARPRRSPIAAALSPSLLGERARR